LAANADVAAPNVTPVALTDFKKPLRSRESLFNMDMFDMDTPRTVVNVVL
jgi:hypothetical protein